MDRRILIKIYTLVYKPGRHKCFSLTEFLDDKKLLLSYVHFLKETSMPMRFLVKISCYFLSFLVITHETVFMMPA